MAANRRFRTLLAASVLIAQFALAPFSAASAQPESTFFIPDPNLRAAIQEALGKGPDDTIAISEIAGLRRLSARALNIADATGLQYATALQFLDLSGNELTEINLSGSQGLSNLNLNNNHLTQIDLSNQFQLTHVDLSGNQLTEVDLSGAQSLTYLDLYGNQLTEVDLSGAQSLTYLDLYGNQLTEVDLSGAQSLTYLDLYGNQLTEVDLSGAQSLTYLDLYGNQLTEVDLSALTELNHLNLHGNQLTEIDLSGLSSLSFADFHDNGLTEIALSGLSKLTHLGLHGNQLTEIDFTGAGGITWLDLYGNMLTEIDLSPLARLSRLNLGYNNIASAGNIAGSDSLTWLNVACNQITDFSPLAGLEAAGLRITGQESQRDPANPLDVPVLSITPDASTVNEGWVAKFTLARTCDGDPADLAVQVSYARTGQAPTTIEAVISHFQTTTTLSIPIDNDSAPSASDSMTATIEAHDGYAVDLSAQTAHMDVADNDTPTPASDSAFWTGAIDSPEFCAERSRGGPATYAFDSDSDGVADTCALPHTRRYAIARYNALEQFAGQYLEQLAGLIDSQCQIAVETDEACAVSEPIPAYSPRSAFWAGTIGNPDQCTNQSLGGPIAYAADSDQNGVADTCALPHTRRYAIARYNALEQLADQHPDQFATHIALQCRFVATTFGSPAAEASDPCTPYR